MDQAELINAVVGSLLEEPALVQDPDWDSFAVLASVSDEFVEASVWRYNGAAPGTPTPLANTDLELFRDLQDTTKAPTDERWEVCIVKIERHTPPATSRATVNFVYADEAEIWRITPVNLQRIVENLRPQPVDFV